MSEILERAGIGEADRMRHGDWIRTYTGRRFWPLDPRPEEVDIRDIAHSLALQCRFAGHCSEFYSVAQHSVLVSRAVPQEFELWALLHDAPEAYLCDLPRPLKMDARFADYRRAEAVLLRCILVAFGVPEAERMAPALPRVVSLADNVALRTEARDLMGDPRDWSWPAGVAAWPETICPCAPHEAETAFLLRFAELGGVL